MLSQTAPKITMAGIAFVVGTGDAGDQISVSTSNTSSADYQGTISPSGNFRIDFNPSLTAGNPIKIWTERGGNKSAELSITVQTDAQLVLQMVQSTTNATETSSLLKKLKDENYELRNTQLWYPATIVTTNFTIPMARFNLVKNSEQKKGDILLFSSIGAGVGISGGRMLVIRDNEGKVVSEEFSNTFGLFVGFLFSAGTGEQTKNVFAPTISLGILDFQIGVGKELGDISDNQKRTFYTLAYSIPLYKLVAKGYRRIFWGDPYRSE